MAIDPILAWSFSAVGVFTQVVALGLAWRPMHLLWAGGRARGVLQMSEQVMVLGSRGAAQAFHFSSISFTTPQGECVNFKSRVGLRSVPSEGVEVQVYFDPARPHDAEVATFRALWLFPVVTSAFGLPFLVVGVAGLL